MKYLIASDIHGSAYWCEKMLAVAEKEQPDKLIFLGDILAIVGCVNNVKSTLHRFIKRV